MIRFMYRAGRVNDCKAYFDIIDKELPKASTEPGYNYAMGLFNQYVRTSNLIS